jgi:hypothetical protein
MLMRDQHAVKAIVRYADLGEPPHDLARAQAGVDEDVCRLARYQYTIAGRAAAQDGKPHFFS